MMRTMQRGYFVGLTVLVSMVLAAVMAGSSVAAPGGTTRVSVDSFGNQADEGPQGSYETSISADGRYVAFSSNASGLVSLSCGPNLAGDVFVRDRQTKTIEWVSVDNCGTEANGDSWYSSISDDGRYGAFDSFASNLVPGDTNDSSDVFVRDRQPETTQPKDCSAPTTTRMLSPQPNAAGWNNSDVGITLNATDTGGSGLKEIRYSINGGEPMIVQQSSVQIPITSEGSTTISYHSTDNAGNVEPQQTFTVKIDKSAPSVSTVAPTNTATGISLTANTEATFSEAMDPNTFSPSTLTLTRHNASTPVAATVNYSSTTNRATQLDQDPSVAGNQNKVWYFTTGRS